MYLENTHTARSGFRFPYTGSQLLIHASDRLVERIAAEKAAREQVIMLTRDPAISPDDVRVSRAKQDVVREATVVEELSVYCTEFARNPDREYNLSLGDVVFFGLVAAEFQKLVEDGVRPAG